jgi:hypothetical protein
MRSYTKAMLAIADGAASSGKRFGNRGSVTAGRFGDTGFPILRALPGRLAARDGPTPTSVQGAAPATPAFQQNAACSPTSKLFGNFSNGSGLRWRSRMCILTATLIVSQLLFACICATAGSPQKPVHTANIIQEVDVDPSSSPVWCYDTEPAFVFSKDSTVFRYDASGKLVWQMSAPWEMGGIAAVSCSTDGKALYFTNNKRTRLSIYSPENGLSEYEMSVPKLRKPDPYSLMSADGNTLALPSTPSIISGKDVLRNKRVVQTDGAKVFWTKDILFVQAGENNRYRMLRISDLSDLGVLKLRPTPDVHGIFECGKTYFALYWTEQLQRRDLELINDRRLQPNGAPTRFDDVGAVDQSDDFCTVSLLRNVRGDEQLETVSILQDRFQERIDLRNIKRLASWLKVSRDRRFILGIQDLDRPTRALDPWTGQPKPNDTRRASCVVILSVAR